MVFFDGDFQAAMMKKIVLVIIFRMGMKNRDFQKFVGYFYLRIDVRDAHFSGKRAKRGQSELQPF
ncbi:MAG: hypothetical protein P1V13_21915 [Rhizobiaceae bacterium]|nr:hypothetical protein [Rhizobiaceae bacterium]